MMTRRLIFFFLIFLVGTSLFQVFRFLNTTPSSDETDKIIEISEGATFREVTGLLFNEKLITSQLSFRILGKLTKNETEIKPGEYRLHRAMRPMDLLDTLVRGDILQYQVVIPEGFSSRQIAKILEAEKLVDSEIFYRMVQDKKIVAALGFEGESLEGYLFPETYLFSRQTSLHQIVTQITAQFKNVYDDSFKKQADRLGMTQREVVTLASIIEKETAVPDERTTVSAVFHNRLKKNMRLQSDPTVIFSLTDFNGNLTRKDLLNKSPYNTYHIKGLPPGPIANPGRSAIYAALNPAEVDYLYFVSKNNGTHHFSKTLGEHNAAVRKYQLGKKG